MSSECSPSFSHAVGTILNHIWLVKPIEAVEALADLQPSCITHLQVIAHQILRLVFKDEALHETYADIALHLHKCLPALPSNTTHGAIHFSQVMLDVVQHAFECLFDEHLGDEGDCDVLESCLDGSPAQGSDEHVELMIAMASFIGHLHIRKLGVTGPFVLQLANLRDAEIGPHSVRCACKVLAVIGKTLDATEQGRNMLTQFLDLLYDVASSRYDKDKSQELHAEITAVQRARLDGWPRQRGSIVLHLERALTHVSTSANGEDNVDDAAHGGEDVVARTLSGQTLVVLKNAGVESLGSNRLRAELAEQLGVHPDRICIQL